MKVTQMGTTPKLIPTHTEKLKKDLKTFNGGIKRRGSWRQKLALSECFRGQTNVEGKDSTSQRKKQLAYTSNNRTETHSNSH